MKPSEINAALKSANDAAEPIRAQLAPYNEQIEDLKKQKAAIVDAYGEKIRAVRASGKMSVADFIAWRNGILDTANEDDRCTAIDAKVAELRIV